MMRILIRPRPTTPTESLVVRPAVVRVPQRPMRVLDFDIENRPLSYLGHDFTTAEVTAIAWAWCDTPEDVTCHLLGEVDLKTILSEFVSAYNLADMVTGHFIRCMTPETRILTADLRWIAAGDVGVGERLVAFDEHGTPSCKRRMRFATVLANQPRREPVYAVALETGQVLHATAEHPWFVGTRNERNGMRFHWRRTDELLGASPVLKNQFAKRPVWLYQVVEPWESKDTRDMGWLAGFFDGEGTLGRAGSVGGALQITAAQNPGATLEYAVELLRRNGFGRAVHGRRAEHRRIRSIRVNDGFQGALRFLGQVRPQRLMANWLKQPLEQALRKHRMVKVVSITPAGEREIAGLSTSTQTYIAEGYAVHNSHDLPMINGALIELGMSPLGDKLTSDTKIDLLAAKGISKSQESLGAMLRLSTPKVVMNQAKWRAANRLTPEGLAEVRQRVIGDVRQHIQLREELLRLGYLAGPKMWKSGAAKVEAYTP